MKKKKPIKLAKVTKFYSAPPIPTSNRSRNEERMAEKDARIKAESLQRLKNLKKLANLVARIDALKIYSENQNSKWNDIAQHIKDIYETEPTEEPASREEAKNQMLILFDSFKLFCMSLGETSSGFTQFVKEMDAYISGARQREIAKRDEQIKQLENYNKTLEAKYKERIDTLIDIDEIKSWINILLLAIVDTSKAILNTDTNNRTDKFIKDTFAKLPDKINKIKIK